MNGVANTFSDKNQSSVPKADLLAEAQFVAELLKYEFVYKLNPESKEVLHTNKYRYAPKTNILIELR